MKKMTFFLMLFIASYGLQAQNNTFLGNNTGISITTGTNNTFLGANSGRFNSSGTNNAFVGKQAGYSNTTGVQNSFFGVNAGLANTTGIYNTFVGTSSGRFSTTGSNNVFVGKQAGYTNNTGGANSFFGVATGFANTTGTNNTFLGQASGRFNTTGGNNTYVGIQSGYKATGSSNVFIGRRAGYNETGSNKLHIDNKITAKPLIYGDFSTDALTVNGSLGVGAAIPAAATIPADIKLYTNGRFSQQYSGNIGGFTANDRWSSLGESFAPPGVTIPSVYGMINVWGDNSMITGVKDGKHSVMTWGGPNARLDFDYLNGANNITHMSITNDGKVGIGTTNPGQFELNVVGRINSTLGYSQGSDERYKENIKDIPDALKKIEALNGVTYQFKQEVINGIDLSKAKSKVQYGVIAQELEKVLPELVDKDQAGFYTVNYDGIIPVLIESVKAQQQVFAKQEDNIAKQQKVITEQQQSITELIYKMNEMETLLKNVAPKLGESDIYGFGQSIVLKQNTPNPTSQITNIEYALPEEITNALLVIYDMSGREINKYQVSGLGSIEFDVSKLVSGTYTYSIIANGINMITRKMVVQ